MSILEVRDLTKIYPAFRLDGISFSLEAGKITGFIGRNGAGKSTTLASLFNFVHPDGGEVSFFGMPFSGNEAEIKRRTGFVSGGVDFYLKKRLDTISAVTKSFYPGWDDAAYRRYMGMFSLDGRKTPSELSAGMKVKYSLVLALSHNAELLVLDEPTAMLDPRGRREVFDTVRRLNREMGITVLFVTHFMDEAVKADRVIVIDSGRLCLDGTPREVFSQTELLRRCGLDVPQSTELCHRLIEKGLDLPGNILDADECVEALSKIMEVSR